MAEEPPENQASASSVPLRFKGLRFSILAIFGNLGDLGNFFLLTFAQLPAQLSQLLLLVGLESAHDFSDPARVLGKDFGDQLFSGGRDASQDKALVFALLLSLHQ